MAGAQVMALLMIFVAVIAIAVLWAGDDDSGGEA